MGKIEPKSVRALKTRSAEQVLEHLVETRDGWAEHLHMAWLWQCWGMVMGEELAPLAIPLGRRGRTLLVGAEDAMAAQELAMQAGEILERVNAFMQAKAFYKVQVELLMGRPNLARPQPAIPRKLPPPPLSRPPKLGTLTARLTPDSAVGKCYAAYLAYFDRQSADKG